MNYLELSQLSRLLFKFIDEQGDSVSFQTRGALHDAYVHVSEIEGAAWKEIYGHLVSPKP